MNTRSLTSLVKAGGCGSKMGPLELREALHGLPKSTDHNFIYGSAAGDDAAVYKLTEDLALVQTVDFFTPIVDDPYDFGAIAAANAISDCLALGARPITGLNIFACSKELESKVIKEILRGGAEKVLEAGAVVVGGHSVLDNEPKYGLAITGLVNPKEIITNKGAKPGDILVLTKKIGTGLVTNAKKFAPQSVLPAETYSEVVLSMKTLNKVPADALREFRAHACTDVTGFGLLGHALNIAIESGVTLEINYSHIPKFAGVEDLVESYCTAGARRNADYVTQYLESAIELRSPRISVITDPQTSGPLLIAFDPKFAEQAVDALRNRGVENASIIGQVLTRAQKPLTIKA